MFALEASRLARNNRDWHHLVDLCALAETLLIDSDGIYDPRQLNDRLLLGLKGTMSEFELNLMRQRAREAFEQKVRRGIAMWELPVGFVRNEENGIEKTPDRWFRLCSKGTLNVASSCWTLKYILVSATSPRIETRKYCFKDFATAKGIGNSKCVWSENLKFEYDETTKPISFSR